MNEKMLRDVIEIVYMQGLLKGLKVCDTRVEVERALGNLKVEAAVLEANVEASRTLVNVLAAGFSIGVVATGVVAILIHIIVY